MKAAERLGCVVGAPADLTAITSWACCISRCCQRLSSPYADAGWAPWQRKRKNAHPAMPIWKRYLAVIQPNFPDDHWIANLKNQPDAFLQIVNDFSDEWSQTTEALDAGRNNLKAHRPRPPVSKRKNRILPRRLHSPGAIMPVNRLSSKPCRQAANPYSTVKPSKPSKTGRSNASPKHKSN